ncbi:hypothetical protein NMG60_11019383 [Bertholletia excelsa]
MENASNGRKTPAKPPQQRIFGPNAAQISEDDASRLVGSIVEKGISEDPKARPLAPSSAPRLTALPFPVARHRSHGPHWAPVGSAGTAGGGDDDDEDSAEEEDMSDFDPVAAFANPVQRKDKRGLDFSAWREITENEKDSASIKVSKSMAGETRDEIMKDKVLGVLERSRKQCQSQIKSQGQSQSQKSSQIQVDTEKLRKTSTPHVTPSYLSSNMRSQQNSAMASGKEFESLESQIDAENRARLQGMSTDEIAEAQAEILDKINPAVIQALKKRGLDKLKKQRGFSSDTAAEGEVGNQQDNMKLASDAKGLSSSSSSLWDTWSGRVESVRELRFSLDGDVVESDVVQVPNSENVAQRDFLRTEGDPAAAGYTIKEAIALTRSVVPGQRTIALHLLASVLEKALQNICQNEVGENFKNNNLSRFIDWGAIWAYALGPEPELALTLRMSLDDNHNSVVLACAKVVQCIMSYDINESYFDILEKVATYSKDICTAPVFRSRPEIDTGFLQGGFWKYNAKTSNILPFDEDIVNGKAEGEHTIQDDVVVAGQDFVAGLVRMGILPRIRYLLETDPSTALEECIISILVAIARHSPTCANAIMKCQRLVQTVVDRLSSKNTMEVSPSRIKSVTLLKVLAQSDKKNCVDFVKSGVFLSATMNLCQSAPFLDQWVKLGRENCRLLSALMVQQLCFWKVCIQYGYCISSFSDFFPALCIWLNVPNFEKLIENNVLSEFASITEEAVLVLGALARRLPNFYSSAEASNKMSEVSAEYTEDWCWPHVSPMVDLALKWIAIKSNTYLCKLFEWKEGYKSNYLLDYLPTKSLLCVISAVLNMLSGVLERVMPEDVVNLPGGHVPWLPDIVPKIGLEIINNGCLSFPKTNDSEHGRGPLEAGSFMEYLSLLRHHGECEISIASVCCLHGLVQVVFSVDKLIKLSKSEINIPSSKSPNTSREATILSGGMITSSIIQFRNLLTTFVSLVASEWKLVQSIEMFGRGGPAPGVGYGWGAVGGGFWSKNVLLAQADAGLLIPLLEMFLVVSAKDLPTGEEMTFTTQLINSAFSACLIVGPRDGLLMDKALDILLQVPVLKYFDLCIRHFINLNKGSKPHRWEYKEEDYQLFSKILASHFRKRWLTKKKWKAADETKHAGKKRFKKGGDPLDTIHEDTDASNMMSQDLYCTSLTVEWAHQRLPLPMHWFLSPISATNCSKQANLLSGSNSPYQDLTDFLEVAKGGLFFLLGIEVMYSFLSTEIQSPVSSVPITWKLHSLSVILHDTMGVLEDEKSRDIYETLQEIYGRLLDQLRSSKSKQFLLDNSGKFSVETGDKPSVEFLSFQSDIHESYSTFIETLVEQFAAVSYGDVIYGRQVAIYLHRCVESPIRLAAWNTLSNGSVLELLPSMESCFANAEGYLEPLEDNESILEAYVKSWISGTLDRAATRRSIAFTLVLHHLSYFVFCNNIVEKSAFRNKLVKSLLRDYSRKKQHEGMVIDFIQYHKPGQGEDPRIHLTEVERRFAVLSQACEGNSSLLGDVEKLKLSFQKRTLTC